jgi:hypothetical protein
VLAAAQGHPQLLELADGQAADIDRLTALPAAADRAWIARGGLPEGFFTSGESAASLIYAVTGGQYLEQSVRAAAADLQRFPDAAEVPRDVAELCRRVGEVPGARLGKLLARLAPDPEARQRRLRELITQIGALAATSTETPSTPPSP